jgi:hypothetical protein
MHTITIKTAQRKFIIPTEEKTASQRLRLALILVEENLTDAEQDNFTVAVFNWPCKIEKYTSMA